MKEEIGYICPQTKKQCDDECCVSAEDCHAEAINSIISNCEPEQLNNNKVNTETQLTAVEWLVDQMRQRKEQGLTLSFYDLEMFASYAKAMEKEHKQSDYMRGWNDGYQNKVNNPLNDNPKSE